MVKFISVFVITLLPLDFSSIFMIFSILGYLAIVYTKADVYEVPSIVKSTWHQVPMEPNN